MASNQPGTSSGSIAVTVGAAVVPNNTNDTLGGSLASGTLVTVQCTGGSAAGTVVVYDGTSTGGTELVRLAGVAIGTTQFANIGQGMVFAKGLFVVVSGTGTTAIISYVLGS